MQTLTKAEFLTCANAIIEQPCPTSEEINLCDKRVDIASEMPGADDVTERMLRELKGMLHPA